MTGGGAARSLAGRGARAAAGLQDGVAGDAQGQTAPPPLSCRGPGRAFGSASTIPVTVTVGRLTTRFLRRRNQPRPRPWSQTLGVRLAKDVAAGSVALGKQSGAPDPPAPAHGASRLPLRRERCSHPPPPPDPVITLGLEGPGPSSTAVGCLRRGRRPGIYLMPGRKPRLAAREGGGRGKETNQPRPGAAPRPRPHGSAPGARNDGARARSRRPGRAGKWAWDPPARPRAGVCHQPPAWHPAPGAPSRAV